MNDDRLLIDAVIEDIFIADDEKLLDTISKTIDTIKLHIQISIDRIVDMFKYYIKHQTEYGSDIEIYECIDPIVYDKYNDGNYYFSLNIIDDDEYKSDVDFLLTIFKEQFGINLSKDCKIEDIFRILLMDCLSYDIIEDDILSIRIYYDSFKTSWLKDYFI